MQQETFSPSSATCPPQMAASRAALLFGCYRRGDANDPDTYCAAVAATLAGFPPDVVEYVTDPRTGIPSSIDFLPTVAEVKRACVDRADYLGKLRKFDESRRRRPIAVLPLNRTSPGRRANVFVPENAPQYERAIKLAETADPADWKRDPEGRKGIWIALHVLQDRALNPKKRETMSLADLVAVVGQEVFDKIPNRPAE